jgi:hypothetical protein
MAESSRNPGFYIRYRTYKCDFRIAVTSARLRGDACADHAPAGSDTRSSPASIATVVRPIQRQRCRRSNRSDDAGLNSVTSIRSYQSSSSSALAVAIFFVGFVVVGALPRGADAGDSSLTLAMRCRTSSTLPAGISPAAIWASSSANRAFVFASIQSPTQMMLDEKGSPAL